MCWSEKKDFDFIDFIEREIIINEKVFGGAIQRDLDIARTELEKFYEFSLEFKDFFLFKKNPILTCDGKMEIILKKVEQSEFCFNSFKFGINGKIDLLLKGDFYHPKKNSWDRNVLIPFELKTGN